MSDTAKYFHSIYFNVFLLLIYFNAFLLMKFYIQMRLVATFVPLTARWQSICLDKQIFPNFDKIFSYFDKICPHFDKIFPHFDKISSYFDKIFSHFDKIVLPNKSFHDLKSSFIWVSSVWFVRWNIKKSWRRLDFCQVVSQTLKFYDIYNFPHIKCWWL